MESTQLSLLQKTLDDIRHQNGIEFWYARELAPLLGYPRWENFEAVINRGKEACNNSGSEVNDHFLDEQKMVKIGSDAERPIPDIKLTRYACYLIAINGSPSKPEIAFAQAYFVTQTRKVEVLQQRMLEIERIDAREKLVFTEKQFSSILNSHGVDGRGIGIIRSAGDKTLFGGRTTEDMKQILGVGKGKPLSDFLPIVTLKAKDLATAMTTENTRARKLDGMQPIMNEHEKNNRSVREALTKSDIYPERLPASEDIKKITSRHQQELRKLKKEQKQELQEIARKKLNKSKS
ncbi:MAG: DNA damage-inducible protein D [Patescibacteria group bacterium]